MISGSKLRSVVCCTFIPEGCLFTSVMSAESDHIPQTHPPFIAACMLKSFRLKCSAHFKLSCATTQQKHYCFALPFSSNSVWYCKIIRTALNYNYNCASFFTLTKLKLIPLIKCNNNKQVFEWFYEITKQFELREGNI